MYIPVFTTHTHRQFSKSCWLGANPCNPRTHTHTHDSLPRPCVETRQGQALSKDDMQGANKDVQQGVIIKTVCVYTVTRCTGIPVCPYILHDSTTSRIRSAMGDKCWARFQRAPAALAWSAWPTTRSTPISACTPRDPMLITPQKGYTEAPVLFPLWSFYLFFPPSSLFSLLYFSLLRIF